VSSSESIPHPLPEALIELVAQRFRVLGEPLRIRLLDQLREREASVGELQEALGTSQQNVSKHLGILHAAGMVSREKQGNHTVYAISDPGVFELCDQVCGGVRRQLRELDAILQPGDQPAATGG
jgi:DNA-binding transcriptional ArsR family regulator